MLRITHTGRQNRKKQGARPRCRTAITAGTRHPQARQQAQVSMKPNGHDDAATSAVVVVDGVPLASAVGADVLKSQIAQLQQYQQAQAAAMRAQIYRQAEVASYQTQARAAQEDLVRCMKEGDHVGGAAATKSLTIACLHLIRLGVEYGLRWVFPKEEAPARWTCDRGFPTKRVIAGFRPHLSSLARISGVC